MLIVFLFNIYIPLCNLDRQSAYASHDNVGATSTSYMPSSRNPSSAASTMEKAEELIRQAVKNSANIESNTAKLTNEETGAKDSLDCSSSEKPVTEKDSVSTQSKDALTSVSDAANVQGSDLASTSSKSDSCASNIDISENVVIEKDHCSTKDTSADAKNPDSDLSPEKRGIKR